MKDDKIVTTAEDSERISEFINDREAIDKSFERAIHIHQNSLSKIGRSEKAIWSHLYEAYRLDPDKSYRFRYDHLERRVVVEVTPNE